MKRKIGLIQALMTDAPVLILDEPTSRLDPLMIEAFCETVGELARGGRTTIFLSSHVLSEVTASARRIALIRQGHIVAVRTMSELRLATPRRVTVTFSQPVTAVRRCRPTSRSSRARRSSGDRRAGAGRRLVAALAHLPVADVSIAPFALADTILRLFGEDPSC